MDEYVQQAVAIVKAQAGFRVMSEEEISSMLQSLLIAIRQIMPGANGIPVNTEDSGVKHIMDKSIPCLECGKSFRLLTRRHLALHGLTAEEYRRKWGYPRDIPLVCKSLQRERRKKMKDMKLWEKRRKKPKE
ncbi:MAG: MucR family transcriptional regulator [Desulfovibrio sp.]|jgi:predicted transcriptional regulator|nr:MucR family transcriptional regulator [Desulfovibrio sp.]